MTELEVGWLVGILEGEGHFRSSYGNPRIEVKMTDEDVIRRLREVTGVGRVYGPFDSGNPRWRPSWNWNVARKDEALYLCKLIQRFMGNRRQAQIAAACAEYAERIESWRGAPGAAEAHNLSQLGATPSPATIVPAPYCNI
jgi:hypothetical protein